MAVSPYEESLAKSEWMRGYKGQRCIAMPGSKAHEYWMEGVAARAWEKASSPNQAETKPQSDDQ